VQDKEKWKLVEKVKKLMLMQIEGGSASLAPE
jgi:hypothetical protein